MSAACFSLRQVAEEDWPALCKGFSDLTFEQSLTYAQAAARRIGAETRFVAVESAGRCVGLACLRIKRLPGLKRGIAWIASGPLTRVRGEAAPDHDHLQAVLAALRVQIAEREGHILRLRLPAVEAYDSERAEAAAKLAGFMPTTQSPTYRTVVTDLESEEESLANRLHKKWRGHLRKALKSGLELDYGPICDLAVRFEAMYQAVSVDKGFCPDIPPRFYYDLKGPDFDHQVLIAKKEGTDLAGITVGMSGSNAVYLFGATTHEGRKLNAGYFLTWEGYRLARARHCAHYDLGGIDRSANPTVTEFKRRAGGQEILAAGPFEARPKGPVAALIRLAEELHGRVKTRR